MARPKTTHDADHFWSLADKSGECWNWTVGTGEYGTYVLDGRSHPAHRVSIMLTTGSFPLPGLVVHHICNNKRCVNPKHLAVVSYSENSQAAWRDGVRKPRPPREAVSTVTVRVPIDLYEWLVETAKADYRSISNQVVHLLKREIEKMDKEAAAGVDPAST